MTLSKCVPNPQILTSPAQFSAKWPLGREENRTGGKEMGSKGSRRRWEQTQFVTKTETQLLFALPQFRFPKRIFRGLIYLWFPDQPWATTELYSLFSWHSTPHPCCSRGGGCGMV